MTNQNGGGDGERIDGGDQLTNDGGGVPDAIERDRRPAEPQRLESFLCAANLCVQNTFSSLARSVGHSHDSALLEADVESLVQQFQRMTEKLSSAYCDMNVRRRAAVDEFLDLQQGQMIACNTERSAAALTAKGVGEGFLLWLVRNVRVLKRIMRMVLKMILNDIPSWFDDTSVLIDELMHNVLSLFASATGLNGSRVASELSESAQNNWAEIAALDELAAMRVQFRRRSDD